MVSTTGPTRARAHVADAPQGVGRLPLWLAAPIVLTLSLSLWFMIWLLVAYVL
jgi:hypothetical protein